MRLGLIFTDDWELFGNGSGDIQERQIIPAHRFMDISEKYGAKYTFMAEMGQYWAFKRGAGDYPELARGAAAWEETLKEAVRRGHDVQLHIHPQWTDAVYHDGQWQLNLQYWNLAALPPQMIFDLARQGKATLENLLKPVRPDYECCCLRSGAWLMQPSHPLIETLVKAGIVCDASVVWGSRMAYKFGQYDYTAAYSNLFPWWADSNDINQPETAPERQTFLEIPIYTEIKRYPTLYPHILKKFRERKRWFDRIYPPSTQPAMQKESSTKESSLISRTWELLFGRRVIMLDHGQLSARHMLSMLGRIRKRISSLKQDTILPVMSITHSKGAYFYNEYEEFLRQTKNKFGDEVVFWGFSEANRYLQQLKALPIEI